MIILDTENDSIQISVDIQAILKVVNEKRKRNITASHRFR